jgi:ATP-dependent DNA helicase RecG
MVREGMEFLKRTMPLGARFPKGQIFREDRFPIPLDALREILLNAVMHRDYSHYSGHVAIVVFDDRIEIRSYGRLPNGITVKQLSRKHISKPTNPLIAGAFHRTGAVEVWGRGTNRVIEMCKKHGAAPPTFEEMQGFLIVTFKAQMVQGGDTGSDIPAIGRVPVEKTVEKAVEKTVEIIIMLLRSNPRITQKEIATETGLSRRGVEWNLREMKKGGLIRRVGPDKGGHWEVVK